MKLALIFVIVASLLVAASFAEPECFDCEKPVHHQECKSCQKEKNCCENPPGRDGRDGRNGRDGRDGRPGRNGANGAAGTDGTDGLPYSSQLAEVYGTVAAPTVTNGLLPFDSNGILTTPGMSHLTSPLLDSAFVTVANAGFYLVTFSLRATNVGSFPAQIYVNGAVLAGAQYSFNFGTTGTNYISSIVQLTAGSNVGIFVGTTAPTFAASTAATMDLKIMSLELA